MNLRKLFGLNSKDKKPYEHAHVLHMWEDDYLMIELLPKENLEFIKNETKRINNFGQEHFDKNSFTDITVIGDKPKKTIDKQIPISEVEEIFIRADLPRIGKVVMQGVGLLEGNKAPLGYGSNNFAVIIEGNTGILENIWITGRTKTDSERQNLKQGIKEFGKQFEFLGVDWFRSEYYDLSNEMQIEKYIKNCC